MSAITTHVLDTMAGVPAAGLSVVLEGKTHSAGWQLMGGGTTDDDGRVSDLMRADAILEPGHYRLTFETGAYFAINDVDCFFPQVTVSFVIRDIARHYHVPLLLSPFSYSTYRGS